MSLLGETVDLIVTTLQTIFDFIISIFETLINLVEAIITIVGQLIDLLYYLYYALEIIISIFLDPYLLGMFILGSAFYYASFTAPTRKELLTRTGIYYKYVFEISFKIMGYVYTIVVRLIVGIIDML